MVVGYETKSMKWSGQSKRWGEDSLRTNPIGRSKHFYHQVQCIPQITEVRKRICQPSMTKRGVVQKLSSSWIASPHQKWSMGNRKNKEEEEKCKQFSNSEKWERKNKGESIGRYDNKRMQHYWSLFGDATELSWSRPTSSNSSEESQDEEDVEDVDRGRKESLRGPERGHPADSSATHFERNREERWVESFSSKTCILVLLSLQRHIRKQKEKGEAETEREDVRIGKNGRRKILCTLRIAAKEFSLHPPSSWRKQTQG